MSKAPLTTVAFIGLGTMGFPMAGHLSDKGYKLVVYNRTDATAKRWLEQYTGTQAFTPAEAAAQADVIITCVGNDQDVRTVSLGENGIMSAAKPGSILIDHTTASAELARELYSAAQQHELAFLDAPVSGGEAGAVNGALTVMVGGEQSTLDKVESLLGSYAKAVTLVGSAGYGQTCKMVNQLCISGILQGLSEALQLAKAADLDIDTVVEVLQHGAAGSWQLTNRAKSMANNQFDFGFAIDWMRKDLAICFNEANKLGVPLPLAKQVDEQYAKLQQRGFSRADTSALIKQFDQEAR
ncbi:NAD(P)-dependent oxidoreductase [Agarivorans sp. 1_MG-2023]|uniref:NAD(P)-dependent oxidoreductase n=1 Tax=Agarivorans sp. 1_MG-2023 TaxID=3062634 RepID=UPI0026E3CD26|nr:NAD(P)-dependent oxidoreductase [Agarivorans sp. 1_MG-2023]MDO6765642.1 NAD(P)-dependent oxidoreductase [Agarivorans sp. 1_MG-2023]